MKIPPKLIGSLAMIVFGVVIIFLFRQPPQEAAPKTLTQRPVVSQEPSQPAVEEALPEEKEKAPSAELANDDGRLTRFADGTVHYNAAVEHSHELGQSPDPREDLQVITRLLDDYRLIFKVNPEGSENYEIVSQLLGRNEKRIVFLDREIESLSSDQLLLDRWGTPYVFHPLTSTTMDVLSPGPDRELWTEDDLSLDMEAYEAELQLYPPED